MVPPFLAYYGVDTADMKYLQEAVRQCQLYDEILHTSIELENGEICQGLWRHIVSSPAQLPEGTCCTDPDVWLTSNAWAVAGITRVLAIILAWHPPRERQIDRYSYGRFRNSSRGSLSNVLTSMLNCTMSQSRDSESGLLKNYLDGLSHVSADYAFGDTAGSALMASAVYRLALLMPDRFGTPPNLDWADTTRLAVSRRVNQNGTVRPVADVSHVPSKMPVDHTSEGQSMVILMYSAWRDCVIAGVCRESDGF